MGRLFLLAKKAKLVMKTFEHSRCSDHSPKSEEFVMIGSPSEMNNSHIDYIFVRDLFWIKSLIVLLVCVVCLMRVVENVAEA